MNYSELADLYSSLEATPAKLEKTAILAAFFKRNPPELLDITPHLVMGTVFPEWSPLELGVGPGLLYDSITSVVNIKENELMEKIKEEGDVGAAVEVLFNEKDKVVVQTTLDAGQSQKADLTIEKVYETLMVISGKSGGRSQKWKKQNLFSLLSNASPLEAKYLVRTVLGELRVGVAAGLVRDAMARCFEVPADVVERAYMLTNDFGKVAVTASEKGEEGLKALSMEVGIPIKPMLAQLAPTIDKALDDLKTPALEIKYDGARIQIHKKGDEIRIFSRRMEEVTKPLPDVVARARDAIKVEEAIIEGEAVAVDPETGRPAPFQNILKRFRRKYDVEKMVEKIPFDVFIFDILFVDGNSMIDEPFNHRRETLEKIIEPSDRFNLADQLIPSSVDEANVFYQEALAKGHEGVMVKNMDAPYIPGARVGHMYKLKPVMETLDLVIIGALWGTGKRKGWLSSYLLGAWDHDTGEILTVGRVGTGVTEEQLEDLTARLKPLVEFDQAGEAKIKPEVVVEIAYQEIQASSKYDSGYALRFPRIARIREDRSEKDADTIQRLKTLYESQGS